MAPLCDRFGSALLALFLAGSGCAPGPARAPEIAPHPWLATIIDGQPADPDVRSTLQIEGGRIFGNAGCNRYAGQMQPEDLGPDGRARIARVASTRMACQAPRDRQELRFLDALSRVERLALQGGRLFLLGPNGAPLVILVPADRH